ncbi:MAG: hypothetical protein ACOCP8_08195 [archaeon]
MRYLKNLIKIFISKVSDKFISDNQKKEIKYRTVELNGNKYDVPF